MLETESGYDFYTTTISHSGGGPPNDGSHSQTRLTGGEVQVETLIYRAIRD